MCVCIVGFDFISGWILFIFIFEKYVRWEDMLKVWSENFSYVKFILYDYYYMYVLKVLENFDMGNFIISMLLIIYKVSYSWCLFLVKNGG